MQHGGHITKDLLGPRGVPVGGGGGGVNWLVRDEFTSDDDAPITIPRTSEPGPGTLTGADTGNKFSIASGALIMSGTTGENDPRLLSSVSLAREVGRTFYITVKPASTLQRWGLGWGNITTDYPTSHSILMTLFSTLYRIEGVSALALSNVYAANTVYQLAIVLRSAGAFYFIKGGAYTDWTLLFVDVSNTTTPLYAGAGASAAGGGATTLDDLGVVDLSAPFDTDTGCAVLNVATAVSGTSYTSVADQIVDLTVTAPDPLANTCELRFRVASDTNYWTAYFDDAGAFKLDSVADGVATNRVSVAGVIAAGQTRTIRVLTYGTLHDCYTLAAATWTKRGSQVNVNHQVTQTAVKPVAGAGWVLGALSSYARTSSFYAELDKG